MSRPRYGCHITRDNIEQTCREIGIHLETYGGVFWHHALQHAFMSLVNEGVDYILCFDHDTMVHRGDILRLLGHARDQKIDALAALQPQRNTGRPLMTKPVGDAEQLHLVQADSAHFGCTIIKTEALKKVQMPWFWEVPNKDGCWAKIAHDYGTHESVIAAHSSLEGLHACDSDIWFWKQWKAAGNSLYVDWDVRIGHAQETVAYYDDLGALCTVPMQEWSLIQIKREQQFQKATGGAKLHHEKSGCDHPLKFERVMFSQLEGKAKSVYSQFGEDGFVEAIFDWIGTKNKACFEFGALDGVHLSGTKMLRERGWGGILIEADPQHLKALATQNSDKVMTRVDRVTVDNINELLDGLPNDCDFGLIDVDGQDYWLWDALEVIRPRVMCVEYNPYRPDDEVPVLNGYGQATVNPLIELGKRKGYTLVAQTFCNLLFVLTSELERANDHSV